jgi:hypothetical protein
MGFASLYPSYKTHLRIPVARSARGMRLAMPSKTKSAQGKPGALSTRDRAHINANGRLQVRRSGFCFRGQSKHAL